MPDIFGIGVDVVDIARIASLRERQGEHFFRNIFTPAEVEYCLARAGADASLAARFAAKEAVTKALGTGWSDGVAFPGVEVYTVEGGRPAVRLLGRTRERAEEMGVGAIHLSLSHTDTIAIAYAVAEKRA